MNRRIPYNASAAAGLSLIELMIAMVIGLVLLMGLVQVMSASRTAYQLSTGVARTQENARFAVDFLQRDLRMAGHLGCVNDQARMQPSRPSGSDASRTGVNLWFLSSAERQARSYNALTGTKLPLRFDIGMQGFEAQGTAPGDVRTLAAGTPVAGTANQWSPALPTEIANLSPIAGSDIVIVRYLSRDAVLATMARTAANTFRVTPEAYGREVSTTNSTGLFGLGDCDEVTLFASNAVDAGTGAVTVAALDGLNLSGVIDEEATQVRSANRPMLYRAEVYVFYVAAGSGRNVDGTSPPSLWRARAINTAGTIGWNIEELVEGVESMQLLYGMDENLPNQLPRGNVERMRVASAVNAAPTSNPNNAQADEWRRIGLVQIGLLMRSADRAASQQALQAPRVLGVRMNPSASDGFYRSVYETTVVARNRMFGN